MHAKAGIPVQNAGVAEPKKCKKKAQHTQWEAGGGGKGQAHMVEAWGQGKVQAGRKAGRQGQAGGDEGEGHAKETRHHVPFPPHVLSCVHAQRA